MIKSFEKQQEQSAKIKNKLNDFLNDKIAFIITLMKRRKLLNVDVNTKETFISIDLQLQKLASIFFFVFFILSSRFKLTSFVLLFKRASFSFQTSFNLSLEQFLNRNVFTIIELYKKWIVELDTDLLIALLNNQYDCDRRRDWKNNERQFYLRRLKIINYIHEQANERFVQAIMKTLKTKWALKRITLNILSKRIRADLK